MKRQEEAVTKTLMMKQLKMKGVSRILVNKKRLSNSNRRQIEIADLSIKIGSKEKVCFQGRRGLMVSNGLILDSRK